MPEPLHRAGAAGLKGKRAAVIVYAPYPSDTRVHRSTQAMVEAGMEVDLLCICENPGEKIFELVEGVRVFRLPLIHSRESKLAYLLKYGRFLFSAWWFLTRRGILGAYDVVHVHNMPDILAFAAIVPKLTGAKVILDLHDPMPELMTTIYGLTPGDWRVGLLRILERWSIAFSNLAVTPNLSFKHLFVARSCASEKMLIVMNSPEETIFRPSTPEAIAPRPRTHEFRVMHHGSIVHRHGIDLLVRAIASLRPAVPQIRLDLYGPRTPFLDVVLQLARELGVADIVHYHGSKSQAEIAAAIEQCHVGVVPNRRSIFTDLNFPTRLFEYLALYRPVIGPATQGIRDYFTPDELLMFEPENVADLAAKILTVWREPEAVQQRVERGLAVYRQHLWREEKSGFVTALTHLVVEGKRSLVARDLPLSP